MKVVEEKRKVIGDDEYTNAIGLGAALDAFKESEVVKKWISEVRGGNSHREGLSRFHSKLNLVQVCSNKSRKSSRSFMVKFCLKRNLAAPKKWNNQDWYISRE